jgi:hypothetical protein
MLNWDAEILTEEEQDGNGHRPELTQYSSGDVASQAGARPTLFIGLGGTGQRIGVYLKALLIANHGAIPDWFRLLVLDTADEPLAIRLADGRAVSLEPGTEFVNIGHVPVGRIIRHRQKQHAIADRFGDSLMRLPPTVLRHGAKQVRLLGLLALYWHFHEVEEHVQRAIWHLAGRETNSRTRETNSRTRETNSRTRETNSRTRETNSRTRETNSRTRETNSRTVVDTEQGINVSIANSLCGGTGAGTFLDVAFLVRALVEELGDLGDFCQVTGLGVLPGAFRDVNGPNLLPNAVSSLMELNHTMTRNDFQAAYPNGRVIAPTSAPFNLYYVLDGVDERGRVWPGINAVCRLAARALYLQMGSQVGRKGENDFDNLQEVLGGTDGGVGTFLGSIGLSVCRFDATAAYDRCASRQAVRLIREGWLRPADEGERLEPEPLMADLALDEEEMSIGVNLALPGHIRRLAPSLQAHETVAFAEGYRATRLESIYRATIETRRRERAVAVAESLRRQVDRLASDPTGGVCQAAATLGAFQAHLQRGGVELQRQVADLEDQIERLDQEMGEQRAALLHAASSGFLMRNNRVAAAQRRYLQMATAVYRACLSRDLCDAALQVLDGLARTRGELADGLDRFASRLHDAARLLESASRPSGDGLPADLELVTPEYVAELYARHAPALGDTAALCLNGNASLLEWIDRPAVELARWIRRGSGQPFEALLQHDVETALREQSDEISPDARRMWLMQQATPSWNLDRSRLEDGGAGLVSVTVLGVPDEHDTVFVEQGGMLVSTQDNQHIIAMRVTVGAPYTALQQFPAWKRTYEQMRGQRPLHILPTFHTSTQAALQAFALGLVFRLVLTQGSWYYYRPADRLDKPERLAQGLQNAVQAFAAQEGLAHEVMERVEQHILVRLTTAQAIERLDAYCEAGEQGGNTDDLDRQLRKAARAYADRLRQTLAASEGILEG